MEYFATATTFLKHSNLWSTVNATATCFTIDIREKFPLQRIWAFRMVLTVNREAVLYNIKQLSLYSRRSVLFSVVRAVLWYSGPNTNLNFGTVLTRSLEPKMQIEHNVKYVLTQNMKPPNRVASFRSMLYQSLQPALSVGTELLRIFGVKSTF